MPFSVSTMFIAVLGHPDLAHRDVSSLRTGIMAGSPCPVEVMKRCIDELNIAEVSIAYGMTETSPVSCQTLIDDDLGRRTATVGRAHPHVEIKIVDPDTGRQCEQGEVGEILIRGPQVMKGYWKMPEETAKSVDADGWFRSGDAGYLDADGYLYIHDRVKDMIVSGGENVYPAEVENVLMGHPAIADVAVIGVPHEKWGETAKAVVVRKPGAEVTEQEIIDFARERLARFKCPTSVDWADALPRNPSGKILKKDLRAPFWEGKERMVN